MIVTALVVLGAGGVLLMLVDLFAEGDTPLLRGLTVAICAAAIVLLAAGSGVPAFAAGTLQSGALTRLLGALAAAAGALTALLPLPLADADDTRRRTAGYLALICWSVAGMVLLSAAATLATLFLGLELLSLALYALTGFARRGRGGEASLKYFLLGGIGSGLVLYGGALVFAASGHLDFLAHAVPHPGGLALAGLALLLAGLGFKLALMPFHLWTPDVYEGAPTGVTAFMAVGTKAAAFAALAHLLLYGFAGAGAIWRPLLVVMAVASLLLGYALASPQLGIKRLLAYSSIANAGTAALALLVPQQAATVLAVYLYTYAAATFGAFAVLAALEAQGRTADLAGLTGLIRRTPWLGAALIGFVLSLASVPLTAGFSGKLVLLLALIHGRQTLLAALVVVGTIVALYPYFKLARLALIPDGEDEAAPVVAVPAGVIATLAVSAVLTLGFGLFPALLPLLHA